MERSALGRAEWMKFYGILFGREHEADSLFAVVKQNYKSLSQRQVKVRLLVVSYLTEKWVLFGIYRVARAVWVYYIKMHMDAMLIQ